MIFRLIRAFKNLKLEDCYKLITRKTTHLPGHCQYIGLGNMSIRNFFKSDTPSHQKNKKEEFVFFFGKNEIFSQFHTVDFEVNGEQYCCMEQYMHYQKAVTFNDRKTAKAIMETTEPRMHKKLGRQVTPFNPAVWAKKSREVVKEGNIAKFSQNKHLREIMFSTYPKTLVEASPRDKLWGIGMGRNNPDATNRSKWRGKNLLGETLTEVRSILMQRFDVDPEEAAKQPELNIYIDPKKSNVKKKMSEKSPKKDKTPKKSDTTVETSTKSPAKVGTSKDSHAIVENSKENVQKAAVIPSKEKIDALNEKTEVTPKKDKPSSSKQSSSTKRKEETSQSEDNISPKKRKFD